MLASALSKMLKKPLGCRKTGVWINHVGGQVLIKVCIFTSFLVVSLYLPFLSSLFFFIVQHPRCKENCSVILISA